jgi:CBS domain-containing protein
MVGPDTTVADVMTTALLTVTPATRPIAEIMTRQVRTVRPQDPARRALETLLKDRIGCVPVVTEDRQLVGIVTETSFLRLAREALPT